MHPWPTLGCLAGAGKGTVTELMSASAPPELSAFKITMPDYRMAMDWLTARAQLVKIGLE